jgi:hypothetical protein
MKLKIGDYVMDGTTVMMVTHIGSVTGDYVECSYIHHRGGLNFETRRETFKKSNLVLLRVSHSLSFTTTELE